MVSFTLLEVYLPEYITHLLLDSQCHISDGSTPTCARVYGSITRMARGQLHNLKTQEEIRVPERDSELYKTY